MIHKVTNTAKLNDVYFEDVDRVVSSQKEAFLINAWLLFYFSTPEAAKAKARSFGISEEIVSQNKG